MIKINQAFYLNRLDHSPLIDPMRGYQAQCRLCQRGDLHSEQVHRIEIHRNPAVQAVIAQNIAEANRLLDAGDTDTYHRYNADNGKWQRRYNAAIGATEPAPVVDPSKQFGLFDRGADGQPMEIGERPGQAVLFHDTPAPLPAKPTREDVAREEARRATLPMFG